VLDQPASLGSHRHLLCLKDSMHSQSLRKNVEDLVWRKE